MRLVRAALLVLLTSSLAGPGVPASFAQTAVGSASKAASSEKRSSTQGSQAESAAPNKKAAASTSVKSDSASSSTSSTKKSSAKSFGKNSTSAAKKASGKSSSKRARKQPGQKAPTADRVIEIQAALAKDGSFQGSPSGKWDDATAAAMRRFQASHGLNPSGKLDAPTLQRLGLGSQTAGIAAPTPPPGAVSRLTSSASVATMESSRQ